MAEGEITPQRDPQLRDMDARRQHIHDFEEYERLNLPQGNQRRREMRELDREFYDRNHFDPAREHQLNDAIYSEGGRLTEASGAFVDEVKERYITRVTAVENERIERKHGRGPMGRVRRWFGDTVLGSRTHAYGKLGLAAAAEFGAIQAPIFAPMLHYTAKRLAVDGILEVIQKEGFEIPRIHRLNSLRLGRHLWLRELDRFRNQMIGPTNDPYEKQRIAATALPVVPGGPPAYPVPTAQEAASMNVGGVLSAEENEIPVPGTGGLMLPVDEYLAAPTLDGQLQIIVEQMDMFEEQIERTEREMAQIRRIGQAIRAGVGILVSAETIHKFFTKGLAMGVGPNLLTSANTNIHDFDGVVNAATGILMPEHSAYLTAQGVQFTYHAGDNLNAARAAGATINMIGGQAMHIIGLGAPAPWLQIGASAAGLVTGMLASHINDLSKFSTANREYHRLQEHRPDDQAVLSFRQTPRTMHGDSSGVHHEIESDPSAVSATEREELNETKSQMIPGTVWSIPDATLLGLAGVTIPANAVRNSAGHIMYQVVGWNGPAMTFAIIRPDSTRDLNAAGLIYKGTQRISNADPMIRHSRKEKDNLEATTPAARIDEILTERGVDIITNKHRVVRSPITVGGITIPAGHFLETLRPSKERIVIGVYSDAKTLAHSINITDTNLADLTAVLENSDTIPNRDDHEKNKIKEANKATLNQINTIVKDHFAGRNVDDLAPGQFYSLGADDWIVINTINDGIAGGQISYIRGDNFAGINGIANDKLKKKEIEKRIRDGDAARVPPVNFAGFLAFVDAKSGTGYANPLIYQFK